MADRTSVRGDLIALSLPAGALVILLALSAWSPWGPAEGAGGGLFFLLLALSAVASIHAPLGGRTLGLGLLALPPAAAWLGPVAGAWLVGAAVLLRRLLLGLLPVTRFPERRGSTFVGTLEAAGRLALAALAAGAVWRWTAPPPGGGPAPLTAASALLAAAAYAAAAAGLRAVTTGRETFAAGFLWRSTLRPLLVDLAGWGIGLLAVVSIHAAGWRQGLLLLAVVAVLSLEAARHAGLRSRARAQVRLLRELARAGHRIIFHRPDIRGIAEQIQFECRRVLPFFWFEFELLAGSQAGTAWHAGTEARTREGRAEVPENPPALPGIHRRADWRIVERQLTSEDETLARLRFWCDPRRLEPGALELLDTLLPQMASAVHRALLDREARHDPLTGLPDRRALESRLQRAYTDAVEEGTPMAVVMCDLDRFKRINDRIGHAAGDRALIEVARLLEDHRRDRDLCCRYGGEEFAVVLERSDGETALRVAERLRKAVAQLTFVVSGRRVPLRVSAGAAAFPELPVRDPADLLQLADDALYEAKRRGRNRCLLNAGGGRFQDPEGRYTDDEDPQRRLEPPTLFA